MYYINSKPTENGNYGNPVRKPFVGCVGLSDELLSAYIETKGFIIPVVEKETVIKLSVNQEALNAYLEDHPDQPETDPEPTAEEQLRADIDYIAVMTGIEL